jgi:Zn-finger nucleic acid-binding protein
MTGGDGSANAAPRVPITGATRVGATSRRCPACGATLALYRAFSVELEGCPACGGVWLDRDELRRLKDRIDEGTWGNLRWLDDELDAIGRSDARPSGRACPKCEGARLLAVRVGSTDTIIEWCPACQGLWLDHGEFERIVAHLRGKLDRMTSAEVRAALVQEIREIRSGPQGALSEGLDAVAAVSALVNITIFEHPALAARLLELQQAGRKLGL